MKSMEKAKGRKTVSVLLLFVFISICFMAGNSYAGTKHEDPLKDTVTMEVIYGYQNKAKGNRYIPLQILCSNSGEAIEGTLSIRSMEANSQIYQYQYPISLPAGSTTSKVVNIPLASKRDQLYLELTDENGRRVTQKRVKMDTDKDYAELFIGILSDQPEHVSYFDNVGIYYSLLRTRAIPMMTEEFPDSMLQLDLLDVLLITDYDVDRLSIDQQNALIEWVNHGGILLLGSGKSADKTLKILDQDYMGAVWTKAQMREVTFGTEYDKLYPGDGKQTLACVDIDLKNGAVLLSSDDFPLLTMIHQEQGKIVTAAFDFVDVEEFAREQPSLLEKMFAGIYGEDGLTELANDMVGGISSDYWNVQSMVQSGNTNNLPKVELYTVVMALYVLLVGPVLYLFLKKREMTLYYRVSVFLSALCFTGLVYMMGGSTRIYSAFFSYATIHEASKELASDTTYINVRVPYNKSYDVQLSSDYTLLPLTRDSSYYSGENIPKFTGTEIPQVNILYEEDKTTVSVEDAVAFTPTYFKMEQSMANDGAYLEGEVTLFDGAVYGYVTNRYPFEVKNAAILMYGKVVQLGDMQPNETRELSGEQVISYPVFNSYVVAQFLSGYDKYQKADIEDPEYLAALERSNMISYYMQKNFNQYTSEAAAVAFYEEEGTPPFLAQQNYECFGRTMLVSALHSGEKYSGYIYRSALAKSPKITSGSFYEEGNVMYGPDPLILEYYLGNDLSVEEVILEPLSDIFQNNEKYYYLTLFDGGLYFYNYNTGSYDLVEEGKERFDREELEPYLSPENTLTIKYVQKTQEEETGWDVILPMVYVIGRGK